MIMNYALLKHASSSEKGTIISFHERKLKPDELDIDIYKILYEVSKHWSFRRENSKNQLLHLTQAWYRLLRVIRFPDDFVPTDEKISLWFIEAFRKHTKTKTEKEKCELLYRFPWHIRNLYKYASNKERHALIKRIKNYCEFESFSFSKGSQWQLTKMDTVALYTIQDDVNEDNEEKLSFQLKENLTAFIDSLDGLEKIVKGEKVPVPDKDKHAYSATAFWVDLFLKKRKEDPDYDDFTTFYIITLFDTCFWHFELTNLYVDWKIA